jgi:precorrin-2 dehydrogenase/sirohydrochlorin ferrochelatase
VAVGLAGSGEGWVRRHDLLQQAGIEPIAITLDGLDRIAGLRLLFVAGANAADSEQLAASARAAGVLVNVEDVPQLCDFHVPATVRRGDLLLSVSTGGKAPGLAKLIREWLDERFGPQWSYRLDHLGHQRSQWRAEGHSPSDVSQRTREFVEERRWL